MSEIEIYKAALKLWGPEAQTLMVFEEMSELQKELCKNARGKQNKTAIAEEIADVRIMLGQMATLHDCAEEVEEQKARKLERLEARIAAAKRDIAALLWLDGRCDYCANSQKEEYSGASRYTCKLGKAAECRPEWRGRCQG